MVAKKFGIDYHAAYDIDPIPAHLYERPECFIVEEIWDGGPCIATLAQNGELKPNEVEEKIGERYEKFKEKLDKIRVEAFEKARKMRGGR